MPQGNDKQDFLKNNLNKVDREARATTPPLGLLTGENMGISLMGLQNLSPCNQEEADTCIMYHCTVDDKPAVVIASDTDILIFIVHVFVSRLSDHDWFLQTKKNQFVNVSKIHNYIGNAVAIM